MIFNNIEIEKDLLGCVLLDKNIFLDIKNNLKEIDFFDFKNKIIYQAFCSLYEKGIEIEINTLVSELELNKKLDNIGGRNYLINLTENIITSSNYESYFKIIKDLSNKRKIAFNLQKGNEILKNNDKSSDEMRIDILREFEDIETEKRMRIIDDDFFKMVENSKKGGIIKTYYKDIDNILKIRHSNYIIIGARTSCYKTTFALNIAVNNIIAGKKVAYFSFEESYEESMARILSIKTGLRHRQILDNDISEDPQNNEYKKIIKAIEELKDLKMFCGSMSIEELKVEIKKLKIKDNVDIVIVDYIQLVASDSKKSRYEQVSEVSRTLKRLTNEFNVCIIGLSQIARKNIINKQQIPRKEDLKESGELENDANVIMLLYYASSDENLSESEKVKRRREIDIIVAKNKLGSLGNITLNVNPPVQKISNLIKTNYEIKVPYKN